MPTLLALAYKHHPTMNVKNGETVRRSAHLFNETYLTCGPPEKLATELSSALAKTQRDEHIINRR